MPAPITIHLEERELRAALERLERRVRDLTPAMRGIATELEARVEERFERRRDPNNSPWAALKDQTLQRKKRKGAILYEHGDLQGSLTSRAGRDFAEVGFGQPYAAYHGSPAHAGIDPSSVRWADRCQQRGYGNRALHSP